ncbi:cytochrome c [Caballeronia sp. LP006]|jgi:cytochrome c553|uniref:c-type cytochrome n=1 Tax=unclassified Caballeronia TaxID=2646786 RepID=UPI002028EFC2|nr:MULTISPECIES: cytochrome c [unclassified Caballeronia]MDR5773744.1 cytochrome c [Caballeronia sp. LZ002]MDR5799473.1 cytochrome c [Caballeronia sp. LZ001]MDR5827309.1 cytochrome c [Caballeronia sp. LP006]MDR5849179.1 cytochrome c [Caballeronia sp. LZ003]
MRPAQTAVVASLMLAVSSVALAAGDIKAGRAKAAQCQACHGLDGMSKLPEAPNLAGQTEEYLVKALTDFHTGARQNEMMSMVAKPLSEADIANLAAYYHSLGKQ